MLQRNLRNILKSCEFDERFFVGAGAARSNEKPRRLRAVARHATALKPIIELTFISYIDFTSRNAPIVMAAIA